MFKDDLLAGKRILVTGGGTGLGRVMAEKYLALGAEVAICGRRGAVIEEAAAEMMEKTGSRVEAYPCDIRVPQAVEDMVAAIWERGPLTGLVNNAAGNFISRSEDLSPRGFDAIANIVLHGTFYVTSAVGTRWLAAGIPGSIINILTGYALTAGPFTMPSAAAKAGVVAMTRSLAVEWGNRGIRVNGIAPGPFPTEGAWARLRPDASPDDPTAEDETAYRDNPMRRAGRMSELANLATFLMADGVDYLTGEVISIDGGAVLTSGGSFARLATLGDEDWTRIREQIQSANARDRAQRAV